MKKRYTKKAPSPLLHFPMCSDWSLNAIQCQVLLFGGVPLSTETPPKPDKMAFKLTSQNITLAESNGVKVIEEALFCNFS